jgi:hypothetical protein
VKRRPHQSQMKKQRRRSRSVWNQKRVRLAKGIAQEVNISDAGRCAGYSRASSAHRAHERFTLEIPDKLKALGCPVERVLQKIISKLDARETRFFQKDGMVIETRQVVAHDVQLDASKTLLKLFNAFPAEGDSHSPHAGGPSFNLVIADAGVAEAILERLARQSGGDFATRVGAALDQDERRAGSAESVQPPRSRAITQTRFRSAR